MKSMKNFLFLALVISVCFASSTYTMENQKSSEGGIYGQLAQCYVLAEKLGERARNFLSGFIWPKPELEKQEDSSDNQLELEKEIFDIGIFLNNERYLSSEKITIGNSVVEGKKYKLNDLTIEQLLVLNQYKQGKDGEKLGGGADSCGYHMIKNAELTVQSFIGFISSLGKKLQSVAVVRKLFAPIEEGPGEWRTNVIDWRNTEKVKKYLALRIKNIIGDTNATKSGDNYKFQDNREIWFRLDCIVNEFAENWAGGLVNNITRNFTFTSDKVKTLITSRLRDTEVDEKIKTFITDGRIAFEEKAQFNLSSSILVTYPKEKIVKDEKKGKVCIQGDQLRYRGESLERDEIVYLVEKERKDNKWPQEVSYSVIDDVSKLDLSNPGFLDEQDQRMVKNINLVKQRLHQGLPFMHVFFICTSGHIESEQKVKGTYGHWFTLLAYTQGKERVYGIEDSINIIRLYNDKWVKKIIEKLEDKKTAQNLTLTNKTEKQRFETGINTLISGYENALNKCDVKSKILDLNERYIMWSGNQFPIKIKGKIDQFFLTN